MAESKPYRLPNVQGVFVTTFLGTGGGIFKIDNDGNRVLYAGYSIEDGKINIPAPTADGAADPGFANALAQGDSNFRRAIQQSIDDAKGTTQSQPDPNQPGAPGGSTPTNPNTPEENENPQNGGVGLIYPEDLASSGQDRIKFQALTYSSNPNRIPSQGFEIESVTYSPTGPSVFLPIQSSITDQNSVGWEPDTLNPIESYAVGLSRRIMESGGARDVTQEATNAFREAIESLRASSSEVRTYLAGQAVGVNNLLSRLNGKVLNPNLELLFQSPQLRPFSFTFKLSPRSANEAKTVKTIINYFKKNMAPIVGDAGLFLSAPNVFKIEYQYNGAAHTGINLIKECALTNCSVDYTPLGTYMTYPDGTMVSYTMTLQFQELEPVYSRDYTDSTKIEY
jgi:type II secretory pathway pseudopilin PulG